MDDGVLPITVNPAVEAGRAGATIGLQMEQLQSGLSITITMTMTNDDMVSTRRDSFG